jgi:hypothetical protein
MINLDNRNSFRQMERFVRRDPWFRGVDRACSTGKKPLRDAEDKFNVPTNCRKKRFKEPPVLKATMSGWESRFFLGGLGAGSTKLERFQEC